MATPRSDVANMTGSNAAASADPVQGPAMGPAGRGRWWKPRRGTAGPPSVKDGSTNTSDEESLKDRPKKWNMGMLNDSETEEVPGSVLLLSKVSNRNEPLGLRNAPARTSASSLPYPYQHSAPTSRRASFGSAVHRTPEKKKKKTPDGKIVLEPQPEESPNDPLNWPAWRRDCALLSLGFFCMLGGGMTPVLAAGFNQVAQAYDVSTARVALTTGLYMMGLGIGSVIASPTAILFGKRPVYLVGIILFILSAVWCALSPNYPSLVIARIFMGIAVSPVECLPSATVAEIFFLHERAYRLGVYTLLLLGGKNLIPLVSAAIINSLGWRWVFWIVAMVVGFSGSLVFLFVPETFWDRTPQPHKHRPKQHRPGANRHASIASFFHLGQSNAQDQNTAHIQSGTPARGAMTKTPPMTPRREKRHAHFDDNESEKAPLPSSPEDATGPYPRDHLTASMAEGNATKRDESKDESPASPDVAPVTPTQMPMNEKDNGPDHFSGEGPNTGHNVLSPTPSDHGDEWHTSHAYTSYYRSAPPKSFLQTLRPYSGRMSHDKWLRVACRPFILFAYPAILWSSMVYALSVGWLIVLSESVSTIYESRSTYNFTSLQAGLIYISPFVGGVLGTAVAGKVSDIIVRWLARKNGGVYEPEFRLVMAIPVAITTAIGLMGYGWSAQQRDAWIVPTIFFGIISFGCCLGSTTSITFAVDSYRQYAGEALVTLNFSKNIFHGLVFSLFFNRWLQADGGKTTFLALGGVQLGCLLMTIPMYIYGKRARMWTVRKNLMEKF